ncbi:YbaB/EbfC family nucleoid-associated protein [Streptomyces sp. NPDC019224]|uniref:YbaB/EbfC family nucleoid-associated protein n=1 Tax=Streptomyces sp. NPDC019224 TaxID=3154484 RepID=UPI0033C592AF
MSDPAHRFPGRRDPSGRGNVPLAALTERVLRLQNGLAEQQHAMGRTTVTGHGGGGLVTATVSGENRLTDLRIDPSVIDPTDPEGLAAVVVEAVQQALDGMSAQRVASAGDLVQGMGELAEGLRRRTEESRARGRRVPPPPAVPLMTPPGTRSGPGSRPAGPTGNPGQDRTGADGRPPTA